MNVRLGLNTFGLGSINGFSFNSYPVNFSKCTSAKEFINRDNRNLITTMLRINNLVFNVLGYSSKYAPTSGMYRQLSGLTIMIWTLLRGAENTYCNRRGGLYGESILTAIAQIMRGIIEEICPYRTAILMTLDFIGTVSNIESHLFYQWHFLDCDKMWEEGSDQAPLKPPSDPIWDYLHTEPKYYGPLCLLKLV